MVDRTNVPGALVIRSKGVAVTLAPGWRNVFSTAQASTGLTQAELVKKAAERHPQLGQADATRLWLAEYFMLTQLPERFPDFRIPLWPYDWKSHNAERP